MVCSIVGDVVISFPRTGMKIQSYDLSIRSQRGKYSYAKAKISRDAAELIKDSSVFNEPVNITFADTRQSRYIYTPQSLSISGDEAWLRLFDARKVLENGVITNSYNEATVEEVVEYIYENREDPHNVIRDLRIVSEEVANIESQNWEEQINETMYGDENDTDDTDNIIVNISERLNGFLGGLAADATFIERDTGGFSFEDLSPNDALRVVESEFAIEAWVDEFGILWIGFPESKPNTRHVLSGNVSDSPYAMKEYNITTGVARVTNVHLTGSSSWHSMGNEWTEGRRELFPIARATIEGIDGSTYAPDEPLRVRSPAALERVARRMLIDFSTNEKNGNIIFNGLASRNQPDLVSMQVGDIIVVSPGIGDYCGKNVSGGVFVIREVQHKLDTRNGWKVTAEVGAVPENITTEAVWYMPGRDEEYETIRAYKNDN